MDIAGADSYIDGPNENLYKKVKNVVGKKMPVCFHECGKIPTVEELHSTKSKWVWFMAWHTQYMIDRNYVDDLNSIYNDEYVITLDELPAWK